MALFSLVGREFFGMHRKRKTIWSASVECCGNLLRLQCCLQNSSAVKGIDWWALAWKGVKKVVSKKYSNIDSRAVTRYYKDFPTDFLGFSWLIDLETVSAAIEKETRSSSETDISHLPTPWHFCLDCRDYVNSHILLTIVPLSVNHLTPINNLRSGSSMFRSIWSLYLISEVSRTLCCSRISHTFMTKIALPFLKSSWFKLYRRLTLILISAMTPEEGEPQTIHSWCQKDA